MHFGHVVKSVVQNMVIWYYVLQKTSFYTFDFIFVKKVSTLTWKVQKSATALQ